MKRNRGSTPQASLGGRLRMTSAANRRGVALMLVLWLVVVLGTIATGVVAATRTQTDEVDNLRTRAIARYAAESGVIAATTRLKAILDASATPEQLASAFHDLDARLGDLRDDVAVGSARFGVTVVDLNARVDLNNADDVTLLEFFRQFVGSRSADALVAALRDWQDADNRVRPGGAEASDYVRAGSPFLPPNRPLRRLDELTRIAGFTDEIARAVSPYVTVEGDGKINVNSAPEVVLAAIPRLGRDGVHALLQARDGGEVFGSIADVFGSFQRNAMSQSIAMWTLVTAPTRVLVVSRGWTVGRPLTHEVQAVYEFTGSRMILRSWTERDL